MAGEEEKPQSKGFTVQDRRRFSPDTGEARAEAPETPEPNNEPAQAAMPHAASGESSPGAQPTALPEIDYSTFVISLSTQALMHLGEIANPVTGKVDADVPAAKQVIDLLGMLREKTRGNLNNNEDSLMENILFDLRMKYVEAVKKR